MMPRILVIDDDDGMLKLIDTALSTRGYEILKARDGTEGLNRIRADQPDIVILDKMLPGIDGFEVARRLRREPDFGHIPILMITAATELNVKLDAFNAGVDDCLIKPFEVEELAARTAALLRRADAFKAAQTQSLDTVEKGRLIAVHSLRGGIGTSSLAVNLALSFTNLWQRPTLLMDMVLVAGQVALMLNKTIRRTWTDLSSFNEEGFDNDALEGIMNIHESGLHFLAAPKNPYDAEKVSSQILVKAMNMLQPRYEYIVADLPHDFSDIALELLEAADNILLVLAPDIVSVRAASLALNTYTQLGFNMDKVILILNQTISKSGLDGRQIEEALHHPIYLVLPYAQKQFVYSINSGIPIVESNPEGAVTALIEDLTFHLSKGAHQEIPPPSPSDTWHRVNKRLQIFSTSKSRKRFFSRAG
jgi:pilus assembly protein CpaE